MSRAFEQSFDRRTFLRSSRAATMGVLAAPYFWTSALSAETAAAGQMASDRVRVAAIGLGGRGSEIALQASRLGDVVVAADVQLGNAKRFVSWLKKPCDVTQDYRRAIERNDVDAVLVGTPDHWHANIAVDAMRAGKDVYCEKPVTLTIAEGALLQQVASETNRVFQVGTQQRSEFDQIFLKAVAIARSGRLGKNLHAIASVEKADVGGPFANASPPADLDWSFWLGPAPQVEFTPNRIGWNFRWWLSYSGGMVTDWGAHHTDIALWALGGEAEGVKYAEGAGVFPGLPYTINVLDYLNGRTQLPAQYNVAREFDCQLTLHNGNTINLVSNKNEIVLAGDAGRIRVNRGGLTGKLIEEINASPSEQDWLAEEVDNLYRHMPLQGHMANFFHCLRTRELPISDLKSQCHAANACHMANIAMLTKRRLEFDHHAGQFVADDEANQFVSRRQREPWALRSGSAAES